MVDKPATLFCPQCQATYSTSFQHTCNLKIVKDGRQKLEQWLGAETEVAQ